MADSKRIDDVQRKCTHRSVAGNVVNRRAYTKLATIYRAMHGIYRAMLCIARTMLSLCPSVCPSICLTRRYYIETAKHIIKLSSPRVATPF